MAPHSASISASPRAARPAWLSVAATGLIAFSGLVPAACERSSPSSASPAAVSQTYTLGADADHPDVAVRLQADRSHMTVADRLTVILTIDSSDGFDVRWTPPTPPAGALGDFTVAAATSRSLPLPPAATGRSITEHTLVLEPFLDGKKTIPAITLEAKSAAGGGASRSITTQPIEIAVAPVLPADEAEKAELAPPRSPIAASIRAARGNPIVAAGAIAALTAWLGAFAWARLVAGRRIAAIDPVAVARRRVADLRAKLAATQADPFGPGAVPTAAIAADLGVTIREYLDRRLHIPATGATAGELSSLLREPALPREIAQQTSDTLAALEQAAFAPSQPRCADLAPLIDVADRLIDSTVAAPVQEAAA